MKLVSAPIRVAIANDYEIIVRGLQHMFENDGRFSIVELAVREIPDAPVDIVLFDAFGTKHIDYSLVKAFKQSPNVGKVALYTWDMDPSLVVETLAGGVDGHLSKSLGYDELSDCLTRIHAGETIVQPPAQILGPTPLAGKGGDDWPGRADGLSYRESEVVALILAGLTNDDIAARLFVTINSVKTFIRSAYRKMGVARRSQAIVWALEHGFRLPIDEFKDDAS